MGIVLAQPDLGTALVFIPILLTMTYAAGVSMRYVIFSVSCIIITGLLTALPLWQTYILRKSLPLIGLLTNPRLIVIIALALSLIIAIALFGYLKYKKKYFFWLIYVVAIIVISLGASYVIRRLLKNYQMMRLIVFWIRMSIREARAGISSSPLPPSAPGAFPEKVICRERRAITDFFPNKAPILFFQFFPKKPALSAGLSFSYFF
jgi:cell division protein FtsW (lipid II flippase)